MGFSQLWFLTAQTELKLTLDSELELSLLQLVQGGGRAGVDTRVLRLQRADAQRPVWTLCVPETQQDSAFSSSASGATARGCFSCFSHSQEQKSADVRWPDTWSRWGSVRLSSTECWRTEALTEGQSYREVWQFVRIALPAERSSIARCWNWQSSQEKEADISHKESSGVWWCQ